MTRPVGRPRKVTDAQIARLREPMPRGHLKKVAHEVGVSFATAQIARYRLYQWKQSSP